MTRLTPFVVACVRRWTRMYTWRLPAPVRNARCQEIESDLWESLHDPDTTRAELVTQMVMRLALGIPDDVAWRLAQVTVTGFAMLRIVTAVAVMSVFLFVALLWLTTDARRPPDPPTGPLQVRRMVGNPPPPPPPPGAMPASEPIFHYGRTSYSVVTEGPPPVAIKQVQPIYPPLAVSAGLEGQVLVQARITERGRVTDAEVTPAGILGWSAIDAVQRWEFAARGDGMQHPALLTVRVSFARSR
jgi:TonB family protein